MKEEFFKKLYKNMDKEEIIRVATEDKIRADRNARLLHKAIEKNKNIVDEKDKEIRKLKKEKKELDDYILELEIVINKAIRYIENNLCDNKARVKENISGKDIDGLLEILGSDKE